jgi:hypothetical protein
LRRRDRLGSSAKVICPVMDGISSLLGQPILSDG